jgi:sulfite dehydrogenase
MYISMNDQSMSPVSKTHVGRIIGAALAIIGFLPNVAWADADAMAVGKALFTGGAVPACQICHALKDAGASGAVGPDFDELKPSAGQVMNAVREGLGSMPSFQGRLTEAEIKALGVYVSKASGGK